MRSSSVVAARARLRLFHFLILKTIAQPIEGFINIEIVNDVLIVLRIRHCHFVVMMGLVFDQLLSSWP
jgi:hypothetical protein